MQKYFKIMKFLPIIGLTIICASLTNCAMKQSQETVGQYLDDSIITTDIKSRFISDKNLSNTTISVKTYHHIVQLSGFVNNQYQKTYATEIAVSVKGVIGVNNAIIIKGHY
ncbi:BON domain-containing protein [soil metagenome]